MRRSKFGAVRTVVDGITFASRKEAQRYAALKLLERAGEIHGLELQPRFPIEVRGTRVCTYVADFRYREGGEWVVEDTKGMRTPIYKLKRKLVHALYGITVRET